jgi:hypothetical protein
MDVDTCEKNGEACVQNCSTYSSPYEQLGCIAGEFPTWMLFVVDFGGCVWLAPLTFFPSLFTLL